MSENEKDLAEKQASLTAGVIGAVMAVLICFGAAFAFSSNADSTFGPQLTQASVQANDF